MDGCGASRIPRNRRTMQAYPITKYAARSIAQTSQTRSIGRMPAASAAGSVMLLVAKDGNGVSTSDMTPFACAVAGVCSRFQTLRCVGIVIGSSSRTAAAHQSVGKIPRGRCFFKNSRSASTSRIIALPLKIAACTPFIPRIPPQALLAAQALLLTVTDHSGSMQTAVPQNHQTPFRPAYRLPPSAPAAL